MACYAVFDGLNRPKTPFIDRKTSGQGIPNESGLINYFPEKCSSYLYTKDKVEQTYTNSSMNYTSNNITQSIMTNTLVTSKRLCEQSSTRIVIAEDINADGAKRFHGFNSIYGMLSYVNSQPVKHFHEVMTGLENRKIYFDADKKAEEGEAPNMLDFVEDMRATLIHAIAALFNINITNSDICFTESTTNNKFSVHVIIPSLNTSVEAMKLLYEVVSKAMNKMSPLYMNAAGKSVLDPNVYKSNQTLRMINCSKMGKDNTKKLWTQSFSDIDTIISHLDDSTAISLIPALQSVIDKRRESSQGQRLNALAKSPELFRAIIMGLNKSRADDFGDWQRVCLALGHKGAGIDIAMMFSRRSDKFNEPATARLYERGLTHTGRSCSIGTLFYMLKQDNPAEFHKLRAMANTEAVKDEIIASPSNADIINMVANADEDDDDYVEVGPDGLELGTEAPEEVKLTGEQKLRRWLSAPEYYMPEPVNDPLSALDDSDTSDIYDAKYMREYSHMYAAIVNTYINNDTHIQNNNTLPPITMIVRGNKGCGKTHALCEYINTHKPERIIYLSFRRSFSNEIMKRLEPFGFVNYRDIEGPITNDYSRIVIQVESLHRIKWDKKCDLFVLDEIESIRAQFFSPTCKRREAIIDKYAMLLRTSMRAIIMDADISSNTITHIKDTRGGHIHYIENTYTETQAGFKEYYTTKIEKITAAICAALDKGEKIVIPTNRSVEYMTALKQTIAAKYPTLKIQMYNSQTIRNEDTAAELVNIAESWIKYDVLIYSPTISAGVSFDEIHFDKCFCIFTNNGKINSMRQMISRVRNFTKNEYYYCLESFGGSSKPADIEAYEKYICSNRFLDKPEFIKSIDDYDGSRQYPYKDTGYYLWIYNQTEKVRDKNMFLYNFLREQYYAGIGQMSWMPDIVTPAEPVAQTITKAEISHTKAEIIANENAAIASAVTITDIQKADIIKRLDNEQPITDDERYQLARRNLLECYDLGERELTAEFVAEYNQSAIKAAYHNRKAAAGDLAQLVADEGRYFNAVCAGDDNGPSIQEDLGKNYKAAKIVIAKELVETAGFSGFYDTAEVSKDTIYNNFKAIQETLIKKMPHVCDVFGRDKRRRPDVAKWADNIYLKKMLEFINSILTDLFQLKIKQTGHRTGAYTITGIDKYDFD